MNTILQFFLLLVIVIGVFYYGYYRGKTIKERELKDIEDPDMTADDWCDYFTQKEIIEDINREESLKLIDKMMTDDDFFTGNIAKSAKTSTDIVDDDTLISPTTGITYDENKFGK